MIPAKITSMIGTKMQPCNESKAIFDFFTIVDLHELDND